MKIIISFLFLISINGLFAHGDELNVYYVNSGGNYKITVRPDLNYQLYDATFQPIPFSNTTAYASVDGGVGQNVNMNMVWSQPSSNTGGTLTGTMYYGVYIIEFKNSNNDPVATATYDTRDGDYYSGSAAYSTNGTLQVDVNCFYKFAPIDTGLNKPGPGVNFNYLSDTINSSSSSIWGLRGKSQNQQPFKNVQLSASGIPSGQTMDLSFDQSSYAFANNQTQGIHCQLDIIQNHSITAQYKKTIGSGGSQPYLYFSKWDNGVLFENTCNVTLNQKLAYAYKANYKGSPQQMTLSGTSHSFTVKQTMTFTANLVVPKSRPNNNVEFDWYIKYDFNGVWQYFGQSLKSVDVVTTAQTGYGFYIKCRLRDFDEEIAPWSEQGWRVSWTGDLGDEQRAWSDQIYDASVGSGSAAPLVNPDEMTPLEMYAWLKPIEDMVNQMHHKFKWKETDPITGKGSDSFDELYIQILAANRDMKEATSVNKSENQPVVATIANNTSLVKQVSLPNKFQLYSNYPNPFNPTTTIGFDLAETSEVSLIIYNSVGQKVRTLVAETKPSGSHQILWDARNDKGVQVPSGIYIYHIKAGNFTQSKRMMLIK